MKFTRRSVVLVVLLILCLILKLYSSNAYRVETAYSGRFFPNLANGLRKNLGWLPISMGDLLYGLVAAWLIYKLAKIVYYIFKRQSSELKAKVIRNIYSLTVAACVIYLLFNILWGINYNRKGIAWQLGLTELKYTGNELSQINEQLLHRVNQSKQSVLRQQVAYPSDALLFTKASQSYGNLAKIFPYLQYQPPSLKTSLWGWFGNYAGFTGYYNPFTGEAQVNTAVPKFILPFTTCHEIAHQLGYAKEMEANFVGYLAASNSADTLFHYSAYLELFLYANRNLSLVDSAAAGIYRRQLLQPVKNDIREWVAFNQKHRGILEPIVRWVYGKFLESNEQPQGILSYDEVTGTLIAYYKKFGKI